jgi:hypothetical protein
MQLGVHPTMLAAKRVALNPVGDLLFQAAEDYAFERAYLEGRGQGGKKKPRAEYGLEAGYSARYSHLKAV